MKYSGVPDSRAALISDCVSYRFQYRLHNHIGFSIRVAKLEKPDLTALNSVFSSLGRSKIGYPTVLRSESFEREAAFGERFRQLERRGPL